jgi:Zn-dependent protease
MNTKVNPNFSFYTIFNDMLLQAIRINVLLAMFNLIPFPPLDGSKMVSSMLNYEAARKFEDLQRYSIVFVILLIFTPILNYLIAPALFMANFIVNLFIHFLV